MVIFYECLISKIDKCLKSNILLRPGSKRLQYFEGGGVLSLVRVSVSRKVWVGIRCPIELISWSKRERKITNLCSPKKRGTRGFMFVTFTSTTRLTSKSEKIHFRLTAMLIPSLHPILRPHWSGLCGLGICYTVLALVVKIHAFCWPCCIVAFTIDQEFTEFSQIWRDT